jgi:cytochrome c peroxidase
MTAKTNTCSAFEVTAIKTLGGPTVPWSSGRTDTFDQTAIPEGLLPNPETGPDGSDEFDRDHLRSVFYRLGFDDQEIVALTGAHSLGRCNERDTGYSGPWTYTPITFNNAYYAVLRDMDWEKQEWDGPFQYVNTRNGRTGRLMMLPTDMALLEDEIFRGYLDLYAESNEKFFEDFSAVFQKLTELGTVDLTPTEWASF